MTISKNIKRILIIAMGAMFLLLSSGCGVDYVKEDGKFVTNPETGAKVVENVIDSDVSAFEAISNFDFYEGFLVIPLSKFITFLGELFNNYAIAIILATLAVKLVVLPLTIKSAKQSKMQRELAPQVQKIQQKYAGRTDNQSKMMQQQEMSRLYKENGVSLLGGCLGMLITIPIFFSFYSAIYRTPGIFEGTFFIFELGVTPWLMLESGKYVYLMFPLLVGGANYLSMALTQTMTKPEKADVKRPYNHTASDQPNMMASQMKIMKYIMPLFIAGISFTLPVGIGIYFITSAAVQCIQSVLVKRVS